MLLAVLERKAVVAEMTIARCFLRRDLRCFMGTPLASCFCYEIRLILLYGCTDHNNRTVALKRKISHTEELFEKNMQTLCIPFWLC
jgi:hypothetical protein